MRPYKTEIKSLLKIVYTSTQAGIFSLHYFVTTAPVPNPLSYCHRWNTTLEICQLSQTDIADETRDFPCIAVLIGNSKSAQPMFLSALVELFPPSLSVAKLNWGHVTGALGRNRFLSHPPTYLKVSSQSRKSEFRVFSIVHLNIYNFWYTQPISTK